MHHPKKRLGQHFLVDPKIARRIVESLDRSGAGPIVEVGPGRGILTDILAGLSRPLFAVEKDGELAAALKERYRGNKAVRIIHGDILALDLREISRNHGGQKISLIGNIPFQITSPLLDLVWTDRELIRDCVLMIQKEVAVRLLSPPGNRVYGGLTVIVNYFAAVERILNVKRGSFFPAPEVDATVVRMTVRRPGGIRAGDEDFFMKIVRTLFTWRRKQVRTTLRKHPDFLLDEEGLDELDSGSDYPLARRPEELSVEDFIILSNRLLAVRDSRDYPHSSSRE